MFHDNAVSRVLARPATRRLLAVSLALMAGSILLAACGSSGGSSNSSSAGNATTEGGGTEEGTAKETTTASAEGSCGTVPKGKVNDPSGAIATLPKAAQERYVNFPESSGETVKSPWASLGKVKGPWKVGVIIPAVENTWQVEAVEELKKNFEEAEAEGLVTGSLVVSAQPNEASATVPNQIAGYQAMVREGVNVILAVPISATGLAPAITEAGKDGVVTVTFGNSASSPYAVNVSPNYRLIGSEQGAGIAKIAGGSGEALVVQGNAAYPSDQEFTKGLHEALAACPDIKIADEVKGEFSNPGAKTAVLQFLASHPGEVNMAYQLGLMGTGVIEGFTQAGREVPPVSFYDAQVADLAYWKENKENYEATALISAGPAHANAAWRVAEHMLEGDKVLVNNIGFTPPLLDSSSFEQFVPSGATTSTPGEAYGGPESFFPEEQLAEYFAEAK